MSSIIDTLISRIADTQLRADVVAALRQIRRTTDFGLVFESHLPELVRLSDHPIRRGAKVVLREATDKSILEVLAAGEGVAITRRIRQADGSHFPAGSEIAATAFPLSELVVVAEFGDPIYPGLRHLGSISKGGAKPSHLVIKAENHHALEALQFTHAGKIDCIYIDPPYNTGARDWKYSNHYVDSEDTYRHSKWLAFMERRLKLAKKLLNPAGSVLIVTIDENELHRLGLLLHQLFVGYKIQMVTSVINPRGKYRDGEFGRCEEQLFFVSTGSARVAGEPDTEFSEGAPLGWRTLRRSDIESRRGTLKGGKRQFYPVYVNVRANRIEAIGEPLPHDVDRNQAPQRAGCVAVFPIRDDGREMNWGLTGDTLAALLAEGFVKLGASTPESPQPYQLSYFTSGRVEDIRSGRAEVTGYDETGAAIATYVTHKIRMPVSTWVRPSHNAEVGGTNLIKALLGEKRFDYPKSLYAVEDALNYFVAGKKDAVILDFFAGSGTTTHAVARLNRRDGGQRQSISITNNEVSEVDSKALRARGFEPGDPEWEAQGIYEHVTRPRIIAAITGVMPDGSPIEGDYKFNDEFPIADGLAENIEFLELTYEDPAQVELGMAFTAIAPLLWLRAGAAGPVIDKCLDEVSRKKPYAWTETYAVLFNTDRWRSFIAKLPSSVATVFIVTDSVTEFSHIAAEIPSHVDDVVRLYERYLTTFVFNERRET